MPEPVSEEKSGIFVLDGQVIIQGVEFLRTPNAIDVGDMRLVFRNNSSEIHEGIKVSATGGSMVINNVFGRRVVQAAKRRPWWRLW